MSQRTIIECDMPECGREADRYVVATGTETDAAGSSDEKLAYIDCCQGHLPLLFEQVVARGILPTAQEPRNYALGRDIEAAWLDLLNVRKKK